MHTTEAIAKARAQVAELKQMFHDSAAARAERQRQKPLFERLGGRGAALVLVARREAELSVVAQRCGSRTLIVPTDVTRRDNVQQVVRDALAAFGHVDVWVNNAGRGISIMPSQLTDADIQEMMQVNVMSAFYGMQEVLPHFTEGGPS